MVEPTTAIIAAIKLVKFMHKGVNSIEREPGKALRAGLRAFEDLRDNPNDQSSLHLARQHFDAAEDEEEGYFKALALMGSALCLNAEGSAKPAARRIDSLLALEAKRNTKVLVKEKAKVGVKSYLKGGFAPLTTVITKALVTKRDVKTVWTEQRDEMKADWAQAKRLANAEIDLLTKLQALVRKSGSNPTKLAQLLEKADLSAL